jgi:hypothetical protein
VNLGFVRTALILGVPAFDENTGTFRRRKKILAKLRTVGKCPPTSVAAEK